MDTLDFAEGTGGPAHVHVLESADPVCFCSDYWRWVLYDLVDLHFSHGYARIEHGK